MAKCLPSSDVSGHFSSPDAMDDMPRLAADFKQNILQVAQALTPFSRGCFYEVGADLEPRGHVVLGGDTTWIKSYGDTYRRYDPFHPRHFAARARPSIITNTDYPADNPASAIYVRDFMHRVGVVHKVEVLLRDASRNIVAGLRLGRGQGSGPFSADALQALDTLRPVLEMACQSALTQAPAVEGLTPREKQVLSCLMEAMSDKMIARTLGVSLPTAKLHVRTLLRKLQVNSRTEAIVKVHQLGLV